MRKKRKTRRSRGKITTTSSSSAAARPGRCWPTACRPGAPPRCCCSRPARTRRTARCRRRCSTAIPAPPTSTRASTGPSSRSAPRWSRTTTRTESPPPLRKYEQARILGGGSSINGQLANRGSPADFEEWVARGARGWGWKDVLPYYKKVERDMDFDGPLHGKEGRIPVRRIFPEQWTGHAKAAAEAFKSGGLRISARPERRVEGRLLPDHHLQRLRAARLGGHRLPRSRRRASAPT